MAYTVTWNIKSVYIPLSDMVLVGGTIYDLDMLAFHKEIRRLEWEFSEGLPWPQILDHVNPKLDFAGADYAGFDEVINGYAITFDPTVTRVNLKGSNNNIVDIMVVNGVSVVPSNSAGLQLISVGSGLSAAQDVKLTEVHAWQERVVHINTELLSAGDGSQRNPFNTVAAALNYAETEGIQRIFTFSGVDLDRNMKNFSISGIGFPRIDLGGFDITGSTFDRCTLAGTSVGDIVGFECLLEPAFHSCGIFNKCALLGKIEQIEDTIYAECYSAVTGLGFAGISITGGNAQVRGFVGSVEISDVTQGDHSVGIATDGRLIAAATCVGGEIHMRGTPFRIDDTSQVGCLVFDETSARHIGDVTLHGIDF